MDAIAHTKPAALPPHPLRLWLVNRNKRIRDFCKENGLREKHVSAVIGWKIQPSLPVAIQYAEITGLQVKDFIKP